MEILFHGATRTVTGSLHVVQLAGKRVLLDCGLFQGPREEARRINCCFDFDPRTVDAVLLSHGHTDHCGNLPNLVKQGFRGPIYATPATIAITTLMLLDSAKIQEENAAYLKKHKYPGGPVPAVVEPLYTAEDAMQTIELFQPIGYRQPRDLGGFMAEYRDAGHVLGSAAIRLQETAGGPVLVFTGDVGRPNTPILRDPDPFDACDVLISESTYGGRKHPAVQAIPDILARIINETANRGGKVIIPAFALGRTQSLIYDLHLLRDQNRLPRDLPIYVDSPLSNRLTEVFVKFPRIMDEAAQQLLKPFEFAGLHYTTGVQESMALNDRREPCVIIAASGMCESGRVLHHLKHHIANPRNTVLLAGYQAQQTLGRKLQQGFREVPILGDLIPLRCRVERLDGLSSHADENELLAYVAPLKDHPPRTYLVHGELDAMRAHQQELLTTGWQEVYMPERGDTATV